MNRDDDNLIRRVADYERISGIFWIILGIVQVCLIYTAIVGIWNIIAGFSRLSMSNKIRRRDHDVPECFEGVWGLVIIGILNLVLGGFIGVILIGFDFFIRDKILSERHLFTAGEVQPVQQPEPEKLERLRLWADPEQEQANASSSYFDRLDQLALKRAA